MNKKQKKMLIRIIISFILFIALRILSLNNFYETILFLITYFIIGYDILKKAIKGILNRQVFDENFLMAIATVGAIALGEYSEGTAVMLFIKLVNGFKAMLLEKAEEILVN